MADILLKSLEIRNFRAFRHLRVNALGRVNLIVGKNNIGKTCLLEALRLYARRGSPDVIIDLLESRDENKLPTSTEVNEIPSIYLPANGPTNEQVALWRDRSVVEGKRKHMLQALRIIQNDVEDVDLVSTSELKRERTPVVKLKDATNFIPLRSLGEGMNRLFIVALGLVNAQNGILLIDEVESGLHYSVQTDLWRLVLQLARELNIQVFATTHSKDCIVAFNEATKELAEKDGVLIRLGRKGEEVVTTLFDEEELEIANEQSIEVR